MSDSSDLASVDVLSDQFEAAWKAGEQPTIEKYLNRIAESERGVLLTELLQIELWWRRDETPSLSFAEYKGQFPDFEKAVDLAFQEFHERSVADQPDPDATFIPPAPQKAIDEDAAILQSEDVGDPSGVTSGDRIRYFGEYELLEEIARGGMGVVFKARQINLNRIVALKMILSGELAGDEEVQRFKTEAEAAANLDHPGIVPIYEIGEHNGQHYFSMGLVEGRSLADRLKDGPLAPREAAELVKKVAEAIAYAHEKGVIHRDLKPANVLLDSNVEPKVTDFGLAKQVESDSDLTRTGAVMGTPSYMPPEQASGKTDEVGPRSDVYSLGAILYCVLTGRPPFQSANPMEILLQVLEREPIAPRTLDGTIPRDAETICLKAIAKEPGRRYQSATEFADDLARWLGGTPICARRVGTFEKGWLWCKRRPAIAGAITVLLLFAIISTAVFASLKRRHLAERIETSVASLTTTRGIILPPLANLDDYPTNLVEAELRKQFNSADNSRKLPLAFGLARYGDVRVEFLLSQVSSVSPDEVDNFAEALGTAQPEAVAKMVELVEKAKMARNAPEEWESKDVATLNRIRRKAEINRSWRHQSRLAMLALHLGSTSLAHDMCQWRPDLVQRSLFIDECSTWHGDLSTLARLMSDSEDDALLSAVIMAIGSAASNVSDVDKRAWESILGSWFLVKRDSLTHSAIGWTLRKWGRRYEYALHIPTSRSSVDVNHWSVNSIGMTMLHIPAGSYVRKADSSLSERGGFNDPEQYIPVEQNVELSRAFLLSDREVTRGHFRHFLDDPAADWVEKDSLSGPSRGATTYQHPVEVSWFNAILFCNWLSQKEKLESCYERTDQTQQIHGKNHVVWRLNPDANGYRLPSEAEWEHACRANTTTDFCHGDDVALLDRYAVFQGSSVELPGTRLPNGWGLFDMHGNVPEWCYDSFAYYSDETTVVDPLYDEAGKARVRRGGGGSDHSEYLKSYARYDSDPDDGQVGFRVARNSP